MNKKVLGLLEYNKILNMLKDRTVSEMGAERAAALEPMDNIDEASALQAETLCATGYILREGRNPIEPFHDTRQALKRSKAQSVLSPAELLRISGGLKAASLVKKRLTAEENVLGGMCQGIEAFDMLQQRISIAILSDEEISDAASIRLADIRRNMRACNQRIKDKLNSMMHSSSFQKYLQEPIITIRNNRYVLPVRQEYRSSVPGMVHDQSATGATLFIEPMAIVEINNDLRQLEAKEYEEIERIIAGFSAEVAEIADAVMANLIILAGLDLIFAKAVMALDMKASEPILNDSGMIQIKQGRHPLIDPEKVVAFDIGIGSGYNCMVITGPNTGGKTVTLKLVGLFTLMAQSGMFIPAGEKSATSVFKNVFADIGDEQSIEQSLSTFSSHMTNIVSILRDVEGSSLVLLDELGAGTDPTEGAALAISILEELRLYDACVMATTHYAELKAYALTTEGLMNASMEFDVATLRPTFRVLMGIPGKSNAFEISQRLGLQKHIIERARTKLTTDTIRFEDVISMAQKHSSAAEEERISAQMEKENAMRLRIDAENELKKLEGKRDAILVKAKEDAAQILLDAKEHSEEIISSLKSLKRKNNEAEMTKTIESARKGMRGKLKELDEQNEFVNMADTGDITPGVSVKVNGMDSIATVLSLPDEKGEVLIQAGIMKMSVNAKRLQRVQEKQSVKQKKQGLALSLKNVPLELHLRGMTVDEALMELDKYLDDAALGGMESVRIVHGKGTGVLRSAVQEHIRRHPHVKKFRLGQYGEGESGVTIIELK